MSEAVPFNPDAIGRDRSESMQALVAAVVAAQSELPAVPKRGKGNYGSYALLDDIMEAVVPILNRHGLAVMHVGTAGGSILSTRLYHSSGEWIACDLPIDPSGGPQKLGGYLTYMRRYGLSCLLGIVTDEDDDGEAAQKATQKAAKKKAAAPASKPEKPANLTPPPAEAVPESDRISPKQAGRALVLAIKAAKEHDEPHPSKVVNTALLGLKKAAAPHGSTRDDIELHLCESVAKSEYDAFCALIEGWTPPTEEPF